MYYTRPKFLAQNFLRNRKVIKKLVRRASFGKKDILLEIGPGKGFITQELLATEAKVIGVEIDRELYRILSNKFDNFENLELHNLDFLKFSLPSSPYKVFANIPFVITSEIIKKLIWDRNFREGYLIIQKDAALRYLGKPYTSKNTMQSIFLKPWFEVNIIWNFSRNDFYPRPKVEIVLIRVNRLRVPRIVDMERELFLDFVTYKFSRKKVSHLDLEDWIRNFKTFKNNASPRYIHLVQNKAQKFIEGQKAIKKVYRTRADKKWRRFEN